MTNPLLDTAALPRFDDISPDHVVPALEELIASNRNKLEALLENQSPDFDSVVVPLEAMEHELARVWSPVSHLQGVLGSPDWRDAYNKGLPLLTEYGTELSQNARLQRAYALVADALGEDAGVPRRTTVKQALRDFKLSGVDLPDAEKARFKEIMQELAATQARFEQNVQDASDAWQLIVDDVAELAGLPSQTIRRAREDAEEEGHDAWLLQLDYPTYDAVMRFADNRKLRERLYHGWVTRASDQGANPEWDNGGNIDRILALRNEAARLVGFGNYAEYSLATKMAATTDEVIAFLSELAERSRIAGRRELDELRELAGSDIEPWDLSYWLEKLKQRKYTISDEGLRQYFQADRVVAGLFELAGRLYGLDIEAEPGIARWHDTVVYYRVSRNDGTLIGGFYADLYARTGKRAGAWVADLVNRMQVNGQAVLPEGFLVCNFPPPDVDGRSLLGHDDVVTLFHEFGHMLHHLLTRVDYPSIAGINGVPWDAVELPSQFMENFAWHYDVLKQCSAHCESGEPLPREIFDRLEDSRHAGAALGMLRQLEFALFDFRLHSEFDPSDGQTVLELLDGVRAEVALLEPPAYNRLPHSFGHIFAGGYAAGYYSYKWAEVLAADAFAAFEEAGIFDADTAGRFRSEILEVGGSRDFMDAYVAFRGRKPSLEPLLKQHGIQ
ncbi:MAG: M3 family metallopeptidase [Pseudomonadota bacterium]